MDYKFPNRTVVRTADEDAMKGLVKDIRRLLRLPQPNPFPIHSKKLADTTDGDSKSQSEGTTATTPLPSQAIDLGLPSDTKCVVRLRPFFIYSLHPLFVLTEQIDV